MPTVSPVVYAEDKHLVVRLLAGDEAAFKQFFRDHYHRLYRFALSRMDRDVGAAEDAAQATLSRALENLASYRGEAQLFTWLCAICRRRDLAVAPPDGAAPSAHRPARGPSGHPCRHRLVGCGRRRSSRRAAARPARATHSSRARPASGALRRRARVEVRRRIFRARDCGAAEHRHRSRELVAGTSQARVQRSLCLDARAGARSIASKRDSMNERTQQQPVNENGEELAALFGRVGMRERPRPAAETAAFAALHSQWQRRVARQRRRRLTTFVATAAAAIAGLGVTYLWLQSPVTSAPTVLATIEHVEGSDITWRDDRSQAQPLGTLRALTEGQRLATGLGSRVALRWHYGGSLRPRRKLATRVRVGERRAPHGWQPVLRLRRRGWHQRHRARAARYRRRPAKSCTSARSS